MVLYSVDVSERSIQMNVEEIALCMNRNVDDVLRELSGEVVPLSKAWEALETAFLDPGIPNSELGVKRDAASALELSSKWRDIAEGRAATLGRRETYADIEAFEANHGEHVAKYKVIVRASEDLMASALAVLRAARPTTSSRPA